MVLRTNLHAKVSRGGGHCSWLIELLWLIMSYRYELDKQGKRNLVGVTL